MFAEISKLLPWIRIKEVDLLVAPIHNSLIPIFIQKEKKQIVKTLCDRLKLHSSSIICLFRYCMSSPKLIHLPSIFVFKMFKWSGGVFPFNFGENIYEYVLFIHKFSLYLYKYKKLTSHKPELYQKAFIIERRRSYFASLGLNLRTNSNN